jgi:putative ABC transport system permease protein
LGFLQRFRALGAEVDPALQVREVHRLVDYYYQLRSFWRYLAWGIGLVTVSVLLLSSAGIYALMSFTVAQRTREIAIRSALGAAPQRLLLTIFGRVSRQLALGFAVGAILAAGVFQSAEIPPGTGGVVLAAVGILMMGVGLLAASGPARRGLRIQPSEALRADG